jgi:arylsulfatase A-like enzyme
VGNFPDEDPRWQRLLNYYLNCIQHTDVVLEGILDELEALGLADNTIIVMTADHGELGGAHGTHGKGATAYREQNHVPLLVSHPGQAHTHGQQCNSVTSHIDLAPTLVNWAGGNSAALRGKDLSPLLQKGSSAQLNEVRDASLFCFNMFLYVDHNLPLQVQSYLNAGGDPDKISDQGFKPDLSKRGGIRSVFDGRYKYSRYFSPKQFNQPRSLEGIFELNDVEVFDLKSDPDEMNNLATQPKKHGDLLLALNDKMNKLLEAEVGQPDDGRFLPGDNTNWAAATFDP